MSNGLEMSLWAALSNCWSLKRRTSLLFVSSQPKAAAHFSDSPRFPKASSRANPGAPGPTYGPMPAQGEHGLGWRGGHFGRSFWITLVAAEIHSLWS